ncbi:MAG: tetratricopeptide repeat protein [Verrucomicrobiota bacterium]
MKTRTRIISLFGILALTIGGFIFFSNKQTRDLPYSLPDLPGLSQSPQKLDTEISKAIQSLLREPSDYDSLLKLAYLFHANGFHTEASQCYQIIVSSSAPPPVLAKTHYGLADLHKSDGRLALAANHLKAAIDLEPSHLPSRLALAEAYSKSGQAEDALRIHRDTLAIDPDNLQANLEIARHRMILGDDDQALKALESLLAAHPRSAKVKRLIAQIYQRSGNIQKANTIRGSISSQWDPPVEDQWLAERIAHCYDAQKLSFLAEDSARIEQFDTALGYLAQIDSFNSRQANTHYARANIYLSAQRLTDAAASLRKALAAGDEPALIYPQLIKILLNTKQYAEAEQAVLEGVNAAPYSAELLVELAKLKSAKGQAPEALAQLEKAFRSDPNNIEGRRLHAEILFELNHPEKAMISLQALRQLLPTDALSRIQMGNYYFNAKQVDKAIEPLEEAYALQPNDTVISELIVDCYIALANQEMSNGNSDSALSRLERALEISPKDIETRAWKAQLLTALKRFGEAKITLENLLQLQPENPAAHLQLGDIHFHQGDQAKAVDSWREALSLLSDRPNPAMTQALNQRLRIQ